jgi:excisionase family DNA binding protein
MRKQATARIPTEVLSVQEAAQRLGTRYDYLYILLRSGRLSGERLNGRWRIAAVEVERYKSTHPNIGKRVANG